MSFTIEKATLDHAEAISTLSGQLGYTADTNKIGKRLTALFENEDNCVYVAVENQKTMGWIHGFYSLHVESDAFVEIGGLVVDENDRNKGIGRKLIEEVYRWAATKNCNSIRVRCNTIRKESHLFYERLGFDLLKEQKIFGKKI